MLADNNAANNTDLVTVLLHGRTLSEKCEENQAEIEIFGTKTKKGASWLPQILMQ